MKSPRVRLALGVAVLSACVIATAAIAHDGKSKISARLSGYQEVPAQSSAARAKLRAAIDENKQEISRALVCRAVQQRPPAPGAYQAHIHFGQFAVNGGISAFLCGTAASPGPRHAGVSAAAGGRQPGECQRRHPSG